MPCWICKAAILALVIALLALLMQVAAISAAVINAIQAIILALEVLGVSLSPTVLTGALGIIVGFSVTEFAEWLCCKAGVTRCC